MKFKDVTVEVRKKGGGLFVKNYHKTQGRLKISFQTTFGFIEIKRATYWMLLPMRL